MKYLIVNADDFGYSFSINKGIIEAHTKSIVTSTSVMINAIAASEATELAKYPNLSVGLHFVIKNPNDAENELKAQINKFITIVGRKPDHVDTHKMKPIDNKQVEVALRKYSKENNTPIRCFGYDKFIGSWFGLNVDDSGKLNQDKVSLSSFRKAIDKATDEYNELMCHVGYSDDYLRKTSSYNDIRQEELKTILNPKARQYVEQAGLTLCNWRQVKVPNPILNPECKM